MQPTRQPNGNLPINPQLMRPSSQPACQPTSHSSTQPSRQPTSQPSRHPGRLPGLNLQVNFGPYHHAVIIHNASITTTNKYNHLCNNQRNNPHHVHPCNQVYNRPRTRPTKQPSTEPSQVPNPASNQVHHQHQDHLGSCQLSPQGNIRYDTRRSHPSRQLSVQPSSQPSENQGNHPHSLACNITTMQSHHDHADQRRKVELEPMQPWQAPQNRMPCQTR